MMTAHTLPDTQGISSLSLMILQSGAEMTYI